MARPLKKGIDYFPFDVDFFSDKKIKILKARYGADGIAIYIYLLCEIYRNGYYLQFDDDYEYIVSDDLNMNCDKIKQVLNFLLERSLFEDKLFQSDKVLTSVGIQRRFQEAVKSRASKTPIEISEFWILSKEETQSYIKVSHFQDNSENNKGYSENKSSNSTINDIKESKVKKSIYKRNNVSSPDGAEDEFSETDKTELKFDENSFEMKATEFLISQITKLDPKRKLPDTPLKKQKWAEDIDKIKRLDKRTEDEIRQVLKFATEDDFWKKNILSTFKFRKQFSKLYIDMNSKNTKPPATVKKNKFHNFTQHMENYSEAELEEMARNRFQKKLKEIGLKNPETRDDND